VASLKSCDERSARGFDRRGGAIAGQLGLGRGDRVGERFVVKDARDPAREVVLSEVVAQHPCPAERDLGFELREVRDDHPGRDIVLDPGIEPLGGLNAGELVAARGLSQLAGLGER
jgi:hypothetical protein